MKADMQLEDKYKKNAEDKRQIWLNSKWRDIHHSYAIIKSWKGSAAEGRTDLYIQNISMTFIYGWQFHLYLRIFWIDWVNLIQPFDGLSLNDLIVIICFGRCFREGSNEDFNVLPSEDEPLFSFSREICVTRKRKSSEFMKKTDSVDPFRLIPFTILREFFKIYQNW